MENKEHFYEQNEDSELFLGIIFDLLEQFYEKNPHLLEGYNIELCYSALEKLSDLGFEFITDEEMIVISNLFTSEFKAFYLHSVKWDLALYAAFPYFMQLWNLTSKVLSERYRRRLKENIIASTWNSLFLHLSSPLSGLKEYLKNSDFVLKGEFSLKGKPLILVESPEKKYYFVGSSEKDWGIDIRKSFDEFKGYSLGENKLYQFCKKQDWDLEEVLRSAILYLEDYPQANFLDFFLSFMPASANDRLRKGPFERIPLQENLSKLSIIISQFNAEGFQKEKYQLFIENEKHELSPLGTWKKVLSKPQKAKNGFHGKDAMTLELEDANGHRGVLVSNGTDSDFFDYD